MNFSRIAALIITLVLIFSMISCDHSHGHPSNDNYDPHDNIQNPNQNQNGEDQEGSEENEGDEGNESNEGNEGKITYMYSVLSKTLHLPNCYHIENIKEDYLFEYTGDITVMLGKGYTICKDCLVPDEEKDDKEEEKEEENLIAKEDATYATHKIKLVIHLVDCYTLESMSEDNLRYTDLTYEELLAAKYRPCGTCMHEEYEQYKKDHPEEFEE